MNGRQRVLRAIKMTGPDRVPIMHGTLPGAVARYGEALENLYRRYSADVLNVGQHCFPETAGAPYGDAYLVGLGVGLFSDFEPLKECWIRGGYVVTPNPEAHDVYQRMVALYLDVIRMLGLEGTE